MKDIHNIRPPVAVGVDPAAVKLAVIIAAVAAGLVLIVLIIRYVLKKRKPQAVPERIPAIPAYDRAMGQLDCMAGKPVHDPRAFYFELGRTVKGYMGDVLGANCLEMTTQELIRTVKGLDLSQELKREIARFQDVCDPFRYAPVAPCPAQVQADLSGAKSLVEKMEGEVIRQKNLEEMP